MLLKGFNGIGILRILHLKRQDPGKRPFSPQEIAFHLKQSSKSQVNSWGSQKGENPTIQKKPPEKFNVEAKTPFFLFRSEKLQQLKINGWFSEFPGGLVQIMFLSFHG